MCLNPHQCGIGQPTEIDIYCRQHKLWAQGISIKVLSSETLPGHFIEEFGVRKCRVQFKHLAEEQVQQLENIIVGSSLEPPGPLQAK